MRQILAEIQSGDFAREWIAENRAGQENFLRMRAEQAGTQVEHVGGRAALAHGLDQDRRSRPGQGRRSLHSLASSRLAFGWAEPPGSDDSFNAARLGTSRSNTLEARNEDAHDADLRPSADTTQLTIPDALRPPTGASAADRRRSAPPRSRAWPSDGAALMGTSHRQKPVKALVGRVRAGLRELFSLPDGYEVALGNGGATAFWDVAAFGLVAQPRAAPHLRRVLVEVRPGHAPGAVPRTTRS